MNIDLKNFRVILIILAYVIIGRYLPDYSKRILYTAGSLIKDIVIWVIPAVVFFFMASTITSLKKRGHVFAILLIVSEIVNNFFSVSYAYILGGLLRNLAPIKNIDELSSGFDLIWKLPFQKPFWWSPDKTIVIAVCVGIIATWLQIDKILSFIRIGKNISQFCMINIFSKIVPLFIMGYLAYLDGTNMMENLLGSYMNITIILLFVWTSYICILFAISSRNRSILFSIKNVLPAFLTGFSTGCSWTTMPVTIKRSEQFLDNPALAKNIIPLLTNMHLTGDCIMQPFIVAITYYNFFGVYPDLMTWCTFSAIFIYSRFAVSTVLGGGMFIVAPLLETYLGFNATMVNIFITANIILDPLVTAFNITGNIAICRIFEKVMQRYPKLFMYNKNI